jgi:sugar phosphate isomerase/epimerase
VAPESEEMEFLNPPFGVSEFTHWFQSFEEDLQLYLRTGVDSIEICERKLDSKPERAREQLASLKASGLRVGSVQPRVHALFQDFMCPALESPVERLAQYRKSIDLISAFFPGVPLVTITGKAPGFNYRLAHETARRLYAELADYAADHGLRIMLEPLHPILMNTDTFICSLREASRLADAVNRENFGVCLDVWHVWDEMLIEDQIRKLGERLFGVHISDWPAAQPRCLADRLLPGDGCINLPALFGSIEASGYRGAYCLEIFSDTALDDSLWRQDGAQVIDRARQGFQRSWSRRHELTSAGVSSEPKASAFGQKE